MFVPIYNVGYIELKFTKGNLRNVVYLYGSLEMADNQFPETLSRIPNSS